MKLKLCNCVTAGEPMCNIFTRAFHLLCERLGIADFDKTVKLHFDLDNYNEAGSFCSDVEHEVGPEDFHLRLTVAQPTEMLRTLCHEMVHCRQYLTGMLRSEAGTVYSKPKCFFYGVPVDMDKIPYDEQPWEVEAYAETPKLADWLIPKLQKEFRK